MRISDWSSDVCSSDLNGELILTWARIHAPSGYVLHRIGVLPTVCTSAAEDWQQVLERFRNSGIERTPGDFALRRHAAFKSEADQAAVRADCSWTPREGHAVEVQASLERRCGGEGAVRTRES